MNDSQVRELKAEIMMKVFTSHCRDQVAGLQMAAGQRDEFVRVCVHRLAGLVRRAETAGVKP